MSATHQTELERFRHFIDEKLDTGTVLSPEEVLALFRQSTSGDESDEQSGCSPIPPSMTKSKRVRYTPSEAAKLLPYPVDEEALTLEETEAL